MSNLIVILVFPKFLIMQTIKFSLIIFILAIAGMFSSCEKDEADTEKPVIEVSGPEADKVLYVGSEIHFEVDFSDNVELKSYKVDIHDNFDGHTHKSTKHEGTAWHFQKSWDFDAGQKNTHIHHHEIAIPTEIEGEKVATGDYHFMVYCTDAAGNESWVAIDVEIQEAKDTEIPVISTVTAPAVNKSFTTDDVITISGTVTDNDHLAGIFVAIMPEGATNEQVTPTDCFAVMLHEHDAVHGQSSYNFTASITVGQAKDNNNPSKTITWTPGNYFILIKSPDESGNVVFSSQYPIIIE